MRYANLIPGKTVGLPEKKELLLEDHIPSWLELRHAHITDASGMAAGIHGEAI